MNSVAEKMIGKDLNSSELYMNSLHILPLFIEPHYTKGVKKTRMIKNIRFRLVIEI